jgi:hypothetical protein
MLVANYAFVLYRLNYCKGWIKINIARLTERNTIENLAIDFRNRYFYVISVPVSYCTEYGRGPWAVHFSHTYDDSNKPHHVTVHTVPLDGPYKAVLHYELIWVS